MKKSNLWMLALIPIVFLIFIFAAASASKSNTQDQEEEIVLLDEETELQTEETAEGEIESPSESLFRDHTFTFTAEEFADRFAGSLPERFVFGDVLAANPLEQDRLQLDILEASGAPADIAIVFDSKEADSAYNRMALAIKGDRFQSDAETVIHWYLYTFLEGYNENLKNEIYEKYVDMFSSKAEGHKVYSEGSVTTMMLCETEETGNYYYIMMSVH